MFNFLFALVGLKIVNEKSEQIMPVYLETGQDFSTNMSLKESFMQRIKQT